MLKYILLALALFGLLFFATHKTTLQLSNDGFQQWVKSHNIHFANADEESFRKDVYDENLAEIAALNAQNSGVVYAPNKFMLYTNEEFEKTQLGYKPELLNGPMNYVKLPKPNADDVDWVKAGAVTGVKDQASCGSCWAFSTTGVLEGLNFINNQNLQSYSEQQLVDCSWGYGNMGCNGGIVQNALEYTADKGISLEDSYPYKGKDQMCKKNQIKVVFQNSGYTNVYKGDDNLKAAIILNPTSVAVDATNFKYYKSGVFKNCQENLNHAVLATGYSSEYWVIKNSWGTGWGEDGYIKLAMGNTCGLQNQACYGNL